MTPRPCRPGHVLYRVKPGCEYSRKLGRVEREHGLQNVRTIPGIGVSLSRRTRGKASEAEIATQETFNLSLAQGWNPVSIPVELENPARDIVFPPNLCQAVWAFDAAVPATVIFAMKEDAPESAVLPVLSRHRLREDRRLGHRGRQVHYELSTVVSAQLIADELMATGAVAMASPGGYVLPSEIHPKRGYWVKAAQAATLTIRGVRPADHSVQLAAGWNLVGPIGTEYVAAIEASWRYVPNAGYLPTSSWFPGEGYWMKSLAPQTIWSGAAQPQPPPLPE